MRVRRRGNLLFTIVMVFFGIWAVLTLIAPYTPSGIRSALSHIATVSFWVWVISLIVLVVAFLLKAVR